jgi:hypothetical protein
VPRQSIAAHGLSPLYAVDQCVQQTAAVQAAACQLPSNGGMSIVHEANRVRRKRLLVTGFNIVSILSIGFTYAMNVGTAGLGLAAIRWKR